MDELIKLVKRLPKDQRENIYSATWLINKAIAEQYKHKWRQTLAVLLVPLGMSFAVVAYPERLAQVIADLWGFFSFILFIGILLTTYQGVHLHRRFSLLMATSMAMALAVLLPFLFFIEVTNIYVAAIVVYNICLACYLTVSFSIYLVIMAISPPKEPYI